MTRFYSVGKQQRAVQEAVLKNIVLATLLLTAPHAVYANTITQIATPASSVSTEYGFTLVYDFAPVRDVPGQITDITLAFSGTVFPGIAAVSTGKIDTVTLQPHANFLNQLPINLNVILPPIVVTGTGTSVVVPFNLTARTAVSGVPQPITTSGKIPVTPQSLDALASGPFVEPVTLFSQLIGYSGNGYIDTADTRDLSNGYGTLTLTVSYTPIPEPVSLALLATGVLGSAALRRRGDAA